MKDTFKQKIDTVLNDYIETFNKKSNNIVYIEHLGLPIRVLQAIEILDIVYNNFNFNNVRFLETGASQNWDDGCFGYLFACLIKEIGGEFNSVDNNDEVVKKSIAMYKDSIPDIQIISHVDDSINFIKNTKNKFNLVHLDSWDLDLKEPLPSMLHGWREFDSIRDKIEVGGIVIIDDNYFKGTWVDWNYNNGDKERIDINYEVIGKGALVYHFCKDEKNGWEILSKNEPGPNKKLVFKKLK
jgi:hypothetical protein